MTLTSGCDACDTLLGQAARAVHAHMDAIARLEQAVLEDRDDISDLERTFRNARQARKEAVEDYHSHCATHVVAYRTAGGSAPDYSA